MNFKVELFVESAAANLYVVHFADESVDEFTKFLNSARVKNNRHFGELTEKLRLILTSRGCRDKYFKNISSRDDCLVEIRAGGKNGLRLFCIRYSPLFIVVGGGGVKNTRTYNEDPVLNSQVERLKVVFEQMDIRLVKSKAVRIKGKYLEGDLDFD